MTKDLNITIVCQAGKNEGLGHYKRALVIAKSIHHNIQSNLKLLIQGDEYYWDRKNEISCQYISRKINLFEKINSNISDVNKNIIILDLDPNQIQTDISHYLNIWKTKGYSIIAVDSLERYIDYLNFIFIPSFQCNLNISKNHKKIIYGWDCFLLDLPRRNDFRIKGNNILILTGGGGVNQLDKILPEELNRILPEGMVVHWVTGPFASNPIMPINPRIKIINHISPKNIKNLLLKANYSIVVYGVSFYELIYYGIPTVVLSSNNKNKRELEYINKMGLAMNAADSIDAVRKLNTLISNDKLSSSFSNKAIEKLSINGAEKFIVNIKKLIH